MGNHLQNRIISSILFSYKRSIQLMRRCSSADVILILHFIMEQLVHIKKFMFMRRLTNICYHRMKSFLKEIWSRGGGGSPLNSSHYIAKAGNYPLMLAYSPYSNSSVCCSRNECHTWYLKEEQLPLEFLHSYLQSILRNNRPKQSENSGLQHYGEGSERIKEDNFSHKEAGLFLQHK